MATERPKILERLGRRNLIRAVISIFALVFLGIKMFLPSIKIDVVTLGIIFVVILPWLSDVIKSAELPGGWKIEFQDVSEAGEKILSAPTDEVTIDHVRPDDADIFFALDNPSLALVSLRIEIERTLNEIARRKNFPLPGRFVNAHTLLRQLFAAGHVDQETYDGLSYMLNAANGAAHGETVQPEVLQWVKDNGKPVIRKLKSFA